MYGIVAGIRSEDIVHSGVVVPDGSDVELLCPSCLPVHSGEIQKHGTPEFQDFLLSEVLAPETFPEDGIYLFHLEILSIECFQTMV